MSEITLKGLKKKKKRIFQAEKTENIYIHTNTYTQRTERMWLNAEALRHT